MLQKFRTAILSLVTLFALAAPSLVPATVSAQDTIQQGVCQGATNPTKPFESNGNCQTGTGGAASRVDNIIKEVINILTIIVGVIAVIMIIIGGLQYITSGGSSEKVSKAKNTILYAIIGLIIVALAQVIVRFVLNKTTT